MVMTATFEIGITFRISVLTDLVKKTKYERCNQAMENISPSATLTTLCKRTNRLLSKIKLRLNQLL